MSEEEQLFMVKMGQYDLDDPVEMVLHVIAPGPEAAAKVAHKWIKVSGDPKDDPNFCKDVISITFLTSYIVMDGDIVRADIIFDLSQENEG